MKGIFIKNPLVYELEIYQESFTQGSIVKGQLLLKNNSDLSIDLKKYQISLQEGIHRKIKKTAKDAFKLLEMIEFTKVLIGPNEELKQEFSFSLSDNVLVTDKTQSLFVTCAPIDDIYQGGFLEITTTMHGAFCSYLDIFTNFQKFKVKSAKSKKGVIEAKLIPPSSQQLTAVDSLVLELSLKESVLDIHHKFKVNILKMNEGMLKAMPEIISVKAQMKKSEYHMFEDNYDQDKILKVISNTIDEVLSKVKIV